MAGKDENQHVYRILFQNNGQVYEVYARNIYQSELYGFVEIEDYTFCLLYTLTLPTKA